MPHLGHGLGLAPLPGEPGGPPDDAELAPEEDSELDDDEEEEPPPPVLTPPPAGPETRLAPVTAAPAVPCPGPAWKVCSCTCCWPQHYMI